MRSLAETLAQVRHDGRSRSVRCPAHDDDTASLSVARGREGRALVHCHAGCALDAVLDAAGLTTADLFDEPAKPNGHKGAIVAEYDYRDETGQRLYQVVRLSPKSFRQRRDDGAGGWVWRLDDVRRVLYRLNILHDTRPKAIFITEGEKDADALAALGLPSTTNAGGAGKWTDDYAAQLVACGVQRVAILPDHDRAGQEHAEAVARACQAAGLEPRVVTLPDVPEKGDVSDWLAAGGTRDRLVEIVRQTGVWTPTAPDPKAAPFVALGALLSEPDDAIDYLVEDRMPRGSVVLFGGRPKGGKSTAARDLAFAVATGGEWLGHRCAFGPVIYLALEDKRSEVRRHFRLMGATGREPITLLIGSAPRDLLDQLVTRLAAEPADLLIVDTAQRLLRIRDTNDYAEVTARFEPILALARQHETCIVLLHHTGKADRAGLEAVLGSTAWAGSVDNIILLNRHERYRVLSSIQRIGPDLPETVVELDETTGRVRPAGTRALVDQTLVEQAIVEAVAAAGEPMTREAIFELVTARNVLRMKALTALVNTGSLIRLGTGRRNDPYRFTLPPREQETADAGTPEPPNVAFVSYSLVPQENGNKKPTLSDSTDSSTTTGPVSCSRIPRLPAREAKVPYGEF